MSTEKASPLVPARNSDEIKKALEAEIAGGEHPPGARLEEESLARRFGVSRTPIREALIMLSASGMIELRPHRGAIVPPLGRERLVSMFEILAELEGICGSIAAHRITPSELTALREQQHLCVEAAQSGEAERYHFENTRFHAILYEGCHNQFLVEEIKRLRRRLQPYSLVRMRIMGHIDKSIMDHYAIIEALRKGDAARARDLLKTHISIRDQQLILDR